MRYFLLGLGLLGLMSGCRKDESLSLPMLQDPGAPAQVLRDFELQDIQNGIKQMTLRGSEGRLRDAAHVVEVDTATVTFYSSGTISSILRAPQGQVEMETNRINAWGGVTVVTKDSATLTTDRLRYDPERKLLLSDDPVLLERPGSITEGHGLEATPDLKRVKIGNERVRMKREAP